MLKSNLDDSAWIKNYSSQYVSSAMHHIPPLTKEERKIALKSLLEGDKELLQEVITEIRKDKIKNITSK
jgi:hypothetical protein